jgi:hypothetical protein
MTRGLASGVFATAAALFLGMATFTGLPAASAQAGAAAKAAPTNYDLIVMKDGKSVEGLILDETAANVKVRVVVAGITAEMDYSRSLILEIKRGGGSAITTSGAAPTTPSSTSIGTVPSATPANSNKTGGVYWITLSGKFAQDITQTPIRDSFRDAKQYRPDIVVIEVDNHVELKNMGIDDPSPEMEKLYQDVNELFRAEKFLTVTTQEVPSEWQYTPRIVYWVKRALGGMAFMPLTGKEVYFAPDGRLGGVGDLDNMIGQGHRRVIEKQISLRRQHAVGWINHSGFPQPETLARGLLQVQTVLSVRFVDGRPVLFEGFPSNPSEELLTDDGQGANRDNIEQIARGLGNDVLNLDQRTAKLIGISKGTVATRDELLSTLGVSRDALIAGRSERIMQDWSRGVQNAYSSIERLAREYGQVEVQGDYNERRAARATQIAKLEQIKGIANRWNEGFDPYKILDMGLPASGDGVNIATLQQIIDRHRLEQSLDRR